MVKPDYIVRSHRRSLSLIIDKSGKLIVRAPHKLSLNDILKYVNEKEKWIESKQKEVQTRLLINKEILNYNEILFLGKKYPIEKISGLKKIELTDRALILPSKVANEDIIRRIKSWYISNAKKILSERVEYFAELMQLDYNNITINNSKNRWGSCDNLRNIKLNFRLIMLPHKLIDYVIIHELTHILEFNHSKDFYKIISSIMPSYKIHQEFRCGLACPPKRRTPSVGERGTWKESH